MNTKTSLTYIMFTVVLITAVQATSQIYYTSISCINNTVCPSNSFCDIAARSCACNFGWAHDSSVTCRYKLRCQQTAFQAGISPIFGYFYLGLRSLGIGLAIFLAVSTCLSWTGTTSKLFEDDSCMNHLVGLLGILGAILMLIIMIWTIVFKASLAQNKIFDENGFPLLISGCS